MEGSNRVSTIMMVRRGQCQRVPLVSGMRQTSPALVTPPQAVMEASSSPPAHVPSSSSHVMRSPSHATISSSCVTTSLEPEVSAQVKGQLCPVCEEKSASHRHYGGLSCLSCKAFFRRAVTGQRERVCKFRKLPDPEALCSIRKCWACRLKRCRGSGMRRELVLSGKKEALKHVGRVNKVIVKEVKKIVRL